VHVLIGHLGSCFDEPIPIIEPCLRPVILQLVELAVRNEQYKRFGVDGREREAHLDLFFSGRGGEVHSSAEAGGNRTEMPRILC
jgi:hypothetical protein